VSQERNCIGGRPKYRHFRIVQPRGSCHLLAADYRKIAFALTVTARHSVDRPTVSLGEIDFNSCAEVRHNAELMMLSDLKRFRAADG